jgi:predicted transcriptional regulator
MMTKEVVSVHEDSSLMECVDHMLKYNVKRLPVIGKDGKITGILYESDIFFAITKAMLE